MKQVFDLNLEKAVVSILLSEVAAVFITEAPAYHKYETLVIMKSGDRFVPKNVEEYQRVLLAWRRYVGDIAPEHQSEHVGIIKMVRDATGAGPATVLDALKKHDWRIDAVMHDLRNRGLV